MMDMHEIVTRAREMLLTGSSKGEVAQWIDSQIPSSAPYDQPRHRCHACNDRGQVEIWHPNEVKRIEDGKKIEEATCLCLIACGCKHPEQRTKYDPTLDCRVVGWDSMEQKRETLRAWLAERRKIENHPNYASEFTEFAIWAFLAFTAIG